MELWGGEFFCWTKSKRLPKKHGFLLFKGWFPGPLIMGSLYGKFPILFPYLSDSPNIFFTERQRFGCCMKFFRERYVGGKFQVRKDVKKTQDRHPETWSNNVKKPSACVISKSPMSKMSNPSNKQIFKCLKRSRGNDLSQPGQPRPVFPPSAVFTHFPDGMATLSR